MEDNVFLVDIICPVYNKSKLIKTFLESFKKNLPEKYFNLILINDGSTDDTKNIVSHYLCKNIKMYDKINEGVSIARNKGLELSRSKYVWFCDPDDEIIIDGMHILNIIEKNKADLYAFSYVESHVTGSFSKRYDLSDNENITFIDYFQKYSYFNESNGISTLWNKIFARSAIKNTMFDGTLSNAEDRMFNTEVLMNDGNCFVSNIPIYNHIIYDQGTLSTVRSISKIENIKRVNDYNIRLLSELKKDVTFERKMSILILCKEYLLMGHKSVFKFYFEQHLTQKVKIFPLIKTSEFLFMLPMNAFIYKILKKTRKLFIK